MDGWTEGRTDGRTDKRTNTNENYIPLRHTSYAGGIKNREIKEQITSCIMISVYTIVYSLSKIFIWSGYGLTEGQKDSWQKQRMTEGQGKSSITTPAFFSKTALKTSWSLRVQMSSKWIKACDYHSTFKPFLFIPASILKQVGDNIILSICLHVRVPTFLTDAISFWATNLQLS